MNLKEAILEEMERRTKARTEQIEAREPGSFKEGIIKTYHEGCRDMTEAVEDARFPMEIQEYVNLAMRTNDGHCTDRLNEWQQGKATLQTAPFPEPIDTGALLNACLGLSGEVGELLDMIKKWIFHKTPMDVDRLEKELGDVCWYIALFCHSTGINWEEVLEKNIAKLKARYPEGFDTEKANNRAEGDI